MNRHTNEGKTINGVKLHEIVKESKTADAIATILASRERIRGFTDIKRLGHELARSGFPMVRKDAEAFFQALEKEGYGSIIRGRNLGDTSRFVWKYDMRAVADAAIKGKEVDVAELPKHMQRAGDSTRIRGKSNAAHKTAAPVTVKQLNAPEQLVINGRTFIEMDEKEYLDLKRIKEILNKLK